MLVFSTKASMKNKQSLPFKAFPSKTDKTDMTERNLLSI